MLRFICYDCNKLISFLNICFFDLKKYIYFTSRQQQFFKREYGSTSFFSISFRSFRISILGKAILVFSDIFLTFLLFSLLYLRYFYFFIKSLVLPWMVKQIYLAVGCHDCFTSSIGKVAQLRNRNFRLPFLVYSI